MTARILVADDDPKHAQLIRLYLEREGHQVITVGDGRSALDVARTRKPDLLVLDVMMPLVDGLDVCRILRAESNVAILLVTARSSENDMLLGLDIGADDYMAKPVSPRELTARVRALLRRAGSSDEGPLRVGDLEVDAGRFEVRMRGDTVTLTAKEFAILELLAKEPGRVFTRAQIIDKAFGFEHDVSERTVDAHIVNLRRKIEKNPADPLYVQTVYGRGYRMAEH
ncbi:DNA-binding response regulator [Paractinoplanes deccanensis]|uniref:DNA-binding response regulator n=1 Tax=Paractinoplanes deccanensis TaxID=113561 RepID=A0ABQ3XZ75_9ACTN|nr:response regulator transcription factor [Actinoplanes deccanensis]GID73045.1 DNA-binding response regulator [Actinoplanes deccanensis]